MNQRIPFSQLPETEKQRIREALRQGRVEVNCPWWHNTHWELKGRTENLFDDCYYRIIGEKELQKRRL